MFTVSNERLRAQDFTDSLKDQLQSSNIHHSWYETPFQIRLNIKKRYLAENSKTEVRENTGRIQPLFPQSTTQSSLFSDSGEEKDEQIVKLKEVLEKRKNDTEVLNKELFNLKQKNSDLQLHIKNLVTEKEDAASKATACIKDLESRSKDKDKRIFELNQEIKVKREELKSKDERIAKQCNEQKELSKEIYENNKNIEVCESKISKLKELQRNKVNEIAGEKKREEEVEKKASKKTKKKISQREKRMKALEEEKENGKKESDKKEEENENDDEMADETRDDSSNEDEESEDDEDECTEDEPCCPECHHHFTRESNLVIGEPDPLSPDLPLDNDCSLCSRLMEPGEAILSCINCRFEKCSECIRGRPGGKTNPD